MAKQQTLTFIVPDNSPDPADIVADALLEYDYGIVDDEIVDPATLSNVGAVIVIIEED